MPSLAKRVRNTALVAVVAGASVLATAVPSSAAQGIGVPSAYIRDVVIIDPLPSIGEIVDPGDLPSCDTPTVSYCIEVGDPVLGPLAVPNVDYDTVHISDVVAWVHKYDVGVGSIGTNQFTCVSLVKPVPSDPCAVLGIAPYESVPLVEQAVDAFIPHTTEEPLTTLTVCSGIMNINDDALRVPTFTVC